MDAYNAAVLSTRWSIGGGEIAPSTRVLRRASIGERAREWNGWSGYEEKNMNEVVVVTVAYGLRLARMRPRAVMHVARASFRSCHSA